MYHRHQTISSILLLITSLLVLTKLGQAADPTDAQPAQTDPLATAPIGTVSDEALRRSQKAPGMSATLRIGHHDGLLYVFRATNQSGKTARFLEVGAFLSNRNLLAGGYFLDEPSKQAGMVLGVDENRPPRPEYILRPGRSHVHLEYKAERWEYLAVGHYVSLGWWLDGLTSPLVFVGFANADGSIASPAVNPKQPGVQVILAYVFHKEETGELGFLVLNGGQEAIKAARPLAPASLIIATAPAIKYTRELVLPKLAVEQATVEPGKVVEWRLPWQTVLDLIPKEDQAKIQAAGGDLDLVWKVGDRESPVLPISLARPGKDIKEQPLERVPDFINLPDKQP